MPKAYSEDLLWRVIYLHMDGSTTSDIASQLYMDVTTVRKVKRIFHQWGVVVHPFKGNPGRKKLFSADDMKELRKLIMEKVDWYLDELVDEMAKRTGKHVSIPTLWRSLSYCGITWKKLHKAAKERNERLRSAFIATVGEKYSAEQLIFLDESAKDERTLARRYGYSFINTRAIKRNVFVRGKRFTILAALSLDGIVALDVMEGSCDKKKFERFIISQLIPQMNPYPSESSVLILDNARIHHNAEWIELVEGLGGCVEFLPPYSPDFNPIESAFGTIKKWLQRHNHFVETLGDSSYAIMMACAQISPQMAQSFFENSIYL